MGFNTISTLFLDQEKHRFLVQEEHVFRVQATHLLLYKKIMQIQIINKLFIRIPCTYRQLCTYTYIENVYAYEYIHKYTYI